MGGEGGMIARMDIGAIFDWDGVVIDSSAAHELSWERLAVEEKKTLPPGHFKKGFGRKNAFIIPEILGWTNDPAEVDRLGKRKEALYREILVERGLEALPGVRELLAGLKAAGIPRAIGSSTELKNIQTALPLLKLEGWFDAIVTAEDVSQGKPHPEVFLKAAQKLGRAPACCVVFEDAHVGIEAARAGGMKCIAVATTHPANTLQGATRIVHRLTDVTAEGVAALFESAKVL